MVSVRATGCRYIVATANLAWPDGKSVVGLFFTYVFLILCHTCFDSTADIYTSCIYTCANLEAGQLLL